MTKTSIQKFHNACNSFGIVASVHETGNYKRLWTRDMVVSAMPSFLLDDEKSLNSLRNGLDNIAQYQHPQGFIPSNFSEDGEISYGGVVGRTDVLAWYIIGVCKYVQHTQDIDFYERHKPHINKVLDLMNSYEFNGRGLMYLPLASNWADEYIFSGYVLFDNVLRLWAYKLLHSLENNAYQIDIERISASLEANFSHSQQTDLQYQKRLNEELPREHQYWLAALTPARYFHYFDAFANSLMLCVLDSDKNKNTLAYAEKVRKSQFHHLLPAHDPVIDVKDSDWNLLKNNYLYHFSNYPYQYHNGGIWPMVQMWYGFALKKFGQKDALAELFRHTHEWVAKENFGYYENYDAKDGNPLGVRDCTWSIAADLALEKLNEVPLENIFPEFYQ